MTEERFLAIVRELAAQHPTGCWEWPHARFRKGYGQVVIDGHTKRAHRVAFGLLVRPLTDDEDALHQCDNRPCLRPDHLFPGTNLDNVRDREAKGRGRGGHESCGRGHPYVPGSFRIRTNPDRVEVRVCRICHREDVARHRASRSVKT